MRTAALAGLLILTGVDCAYANVVWPVTRELALFGGQFFLAFWISVGMGLGFEFFFLHGVLKASSIWVAIVVLVANFGSAMAGVFLLFGRKSRPFQESIFRNLHGKTQALFAVFVITSIASAVIEMAVYKFMFVMDSGWYEFYRVAYANAISTGVALLPFVWPVSRLLDHWAAYRMRRSEIRRQTRMRPG